MKHYIIEQTRPHYGREYTFTAMCMELRDAKAFFNSMHNAHRQEQVRTVLYDCVGDHREMLECRENYECNGQTLQRRTSQSVT